MEITDLTLTNLKITNLKVTNLKVTDFIYLVQSGGVRNFEVNFNL